MLLIRFHVLLSLRLNMKISHFLKIAQEFIQPMKLHIHPPRKAETGHSTYPPQAALWLPHYPSGTGMLLPLSVAESGTSFVFILNTDIQIMYVVLSHIS